MKHSHKIGICFGVTSGIITTMGLMVGLDAGTNSKLAVLGGILTIAIADSFSDALGMHMSVESGDSTTEKEIWESTIATFLAKLVFSSSFIIPVLLISNLFHAMIINICWGALVLTVLTYIIAKDKKENVIRALAEHLGTAAVVIVLTTLAGKLIAKYFGADA
jgi:VIT1/CCC1 family predicted Fe2+/Mn2+ transporter